MKIQFRTSEGPVVNWIQVLGDQNLMCFDRQYNFYQVSDTGSCRETRLTLFFIVKIYLR